jgi:hypothetical protein
MLSFNWACIGVIILYCLKYNILSRESSVLVMLHVLIVPFIELGELAYKDFWKLNLFVWTMYVDIENQL